MGLVLPFRPALPRARPVHGRGAARRERRDPPRARGGGERGRASGWHEAALPLDRLTEGPVEIVLSYEAEGKDAPAGPARPGRSRTSTGRGGPTAPNVLLVSIDTLRADHLGSHGYRRPTSPRLDAFAKTPCASPGLRPVAVDDAVARVDAHRPLPLRPPGEPVVHRARALPGRPGRLPPPLAPGWRRSPSSCGGRATALSRGRAGGRRLDARLRPGLRRVRERHRARPGHFSRLTGWLDAYGTRRGSLPAHLRGPRAVQADRLASGVLSADERAEIDRMRSEDDRRLRALQEPPAVRGSCAAT